MFEDLTQRLDGVLRKMRGQTSISEENIAEPLKEVRRALLEADVQFQVARDFVDRVRKKSPTLQPTRGVCRILSQSIRSRRLRRIGGRSREAVDGGEIGDFVVGEGTGAGSVVRTADHGHRGRSSRRTARGR